MEETKSIEVKMDKSAPELQVSVDKPILLIPKQKQIDIKAILGTNDDMSGIESVVLESITMNDEKQYPSDIAFATTGTDDREFALRATRGEKGKVS